jgi:hypothetical protein
MERVEQKGQKVGKYEDGFERSAILSGAEPVIGAPRCTKAFDPSRCRPLHLPDLPDLFVGLLSPCALHLQVGESGN